MIKLIKPKFWDKKIGLYAIVFFPISLIFIFFSFLRKKLSYTKKFKTFIICVGNIYIGGTGKTPTSILLANEFTRLGKKTAILRKFYKNHFDEYNLIKNSFKNLIINNNRVDGLKDAELSGYDIVILDDGLQDFKIEKNLKIVCFNSNQLIGNGLVLPSGPLRESLFSLKKTDIVIINGDKNKFFEEKIFNINKKIKIFYSYYKPLNLGEFKDKRLMAIAGIGNPENFFKLIEKNNLKLKKKIVFPDHYKFSRNEIQKLIDEADKKNYEIIMTEKDYFKIVEYKFKKINFLKTELEINEKEKFLNAINYLND